MRVCTYECGALEPELFTRNIIRKPCLGCKGWYDPYDIEVMAMEDRMGLPVVVAVVILRRKQGKSYFTGKGEA